MKILALLLFAATAHADIGQVTGGAGGVMAGDNTAFSGANSFSGATTFTGVVTFSSTITANSSLSAYPSPQSHISTANYSGIIKGSEAQIALASGTAVATFTVYGIISTYTTTVELRVTQVGAAGTYKLNFDNDYGASYDYFGSRHWSGTTEANSNNQGDVFCALMTNTVVGGGALAKVGEQVIIKLNISRTPGTQTDRAYVQWNTAYVDNGGGTGMANTFGECWYKTANAGDGLWNLSIYPTAGTMTGHLDVWAKVPSVAHP